MLLNKKNQKKLENTLLGSIKAVVSRCDDEYCDIEIESEIFASEFFNRWFFDFGKASFVVFRKNLAETNIQLTELISLLRYSTSLKEEKAFQCATTSVFKQHLYHLWIDHNSQLRNPVKVKYAIKRFSEFYGELLSRTLVIDAYHGTASVYTPPTITVDFEKVCGLSGYIHSCGKLIFSRNIQKINENSIKRNLIAACKKDTSEKKIAFCIFSKNGFASKNLHELEEQLHGLESLKIQDEKYYVDRLPLREAIYNVFQDNDINEKLLWIDPIKYSSVVRDDDINDFNNDGVHSDRIIWLLLDHKIDSHGSKNHACKYYIFYEQQYRNANPCYIYDEAKPAWKAPETMPHSLNAAMLNIAISSYNSNSDITIHDPFCGTGTSILEGLKVKNAKCTGGDIEDVSRLLIYDNLRYFAASKPDLNGYYSVLLKCLKTKFEEAKDNRFKQNSELRRAWEIFCALIDRISNSNKIYYDTQCIDLLKKNTDSLIVNILFYLIYRAAFKVNVRNNVTELLNSKKLFVEINNRIKAHSEMLGRHLDLYQWTKDPKEIKNTNLLKSNGKFAQWIFPSKSVIKDYITSDYDNCVKIQDAKNEILHADIYIADPPYGVNVKHADDNLMSLYKAMIENFIINVKESRGHVVLCLPSETHTGLMPFFYTNPKLITCQFSTFTALHQAKLNVEASVLPQPASLFRVPSYWRAPKTLDRTILHFDISG